MSGVDKFGNSAKRLKSETSEGYFLSRTGLQSDFDAKHKKIINLDGPTDGTDAVNLAFLQSDFLSRSGQDYDAKNNKIINLAVPTSESDAASMAYVKSVISFSKDGEGNLNLAGNKIINLGHPTSSNHALNLGYLTNEIGISKSRENNISVNNRKLVNLISPTEDTHAATKQYVDRTLSREINKIRSAPQVGSRVYTFRSNLQTQPNAKWLAIDNQQFYHVVQPTRIVKIIVLSARVNNEIHLRLEIGATNSILIEKRAGQIATTINFEKNNIEIPIGSEISISNAKVTPPGRHSLEIQCTY